MSGIDAKNWLRLLDSACSKAHCSEVDFIIDQVDIATPLFPGLEHVEPPIPWQALFDGLPEAVHADLSPLLVRIDLGEPQQRLWLEGMISRFGGEARLLALISHWPLQRLGEHLGQCLEARNGGATGLLRYYDPRLFPLLFSDVLTPEQQQHFLVPVVLWSWLDRDGTPRHRVGTAMQPGDVEAPSPFELSDRQIDVLCCAGDTLQTLARLRAALPQPWSAEQAFQHCYRAVLEADDAGLLSCAKSDPFVLDKLLSAWAGGEA